MKLQQLRYLAAVAQNDMNITATANRLHTSQSGISKQLRLLEVSQPRVSKLMKGTWQDFSLDMLITLAHRAGMRPTLKIAAQE